jgi:hypothetical protein
MLSSTGLDLSQQEALVHAMTHRLAIIQGPPGCGKTFVGIKLIQIMLSINPRPKTPILVLTYKNHALDEFLKGLLSFIDIDDIVRIGGRSREAALDPCNLRKILREVRNGEGSSLQQKIDSLRDELRSTNGKVEELMMALNGCSSLTVEDLLEVWTEEQLRNFLLAAPSSEDVLSGLLGKRPASRRRGGSARYPPVLLTYGKMYLPTDTFFIADFFLEEFIVSVCGVCLDSVAKLKLFVSAPVLTFKKFRLRLQLVPYLLSQRLYEKVNMILGKNTDSSYYSSLILHICMS